MPNDTPTSARTRLLTGTLWSMVGLAALGVTRLVYTALVGRTGSPDRLAEVNTQISLAFLATFCVAAATGAAAAKFLPLAAARHGNAAAAAVSRKLVRWTVLGSAVLAIGLALLGPLVLPNPTGSDVLWMIALTIAYGAYTYAKQALYGWRLPSRYAVLEVCADVAIIGSAVVAVFWLPGYLLAPLVIGYAGFAIAAAFAVPRHRPGPMPDLGQGELGGFVLYSALGIATGQGFFQLSMVFAQHLTSGAQPGLYAAAMALIGPAFFAPRAMALAFFPTAAEAVGRGDYAALTRQTDMLTRMLVLTMLPAFAVAAMVGGPALRLVFGPAYEGGGAIVALLLAAVLLYVVAVPSVNLLSASVLAHARIPPGASSLGLLVGLLVWTFAGGMVFASGNGASTAGGAVVAAGYLVGMLVQAGLPLYITFGLPSRTMSWGRSFSVRLVVGLAAAVGFATFAVRLPEPAIIACCVLGFLVVYGLLHGREVLSVLRQVHAARPGSR